MSVMINVARLCLYLFRNQPRSVVWKAFWNFHILPKYLEEEYPVLKTLIFIKISKFSILLTIELIPAVAKSLRNNQLSKITQKTRKYYTNECTLSHEKHVSLLQGVLDILRAFTSMKTLKSEEGRYSRTRERGNSWFVVPLICPFID